jgi:hypothetical protein
MANRNTLHRNMLGDFQRYLVKRGETLLIPKGTWEVLRWQPPPGQPMPIVFDRLKGDHLSINDAAWPYVKAFLWYRKTNPEVAKPAPTEPGTDAPWD